MSVQNLIQQTDNLLADAKESLQQAELATLHWSDQVHRLTEARENLTKIFPDAGEMAPVKFKQSARKPEGKKERAVSIPKTDKAFWIGLMSNEPQKTAEILSKAAAGLHIKEDSHDEMNLLKQRLSSSLQNLVADNSIASEGERMNRTYQLPKT